MDPGIVRCDMIAESIIQAASALGGFRVPVVVRLQGTNCDAAMKMVSQHSFSQGVTKLTCGL
jgi:succinyl-CoA synthetase beta subunit